MMIFELILARCRKSAKIAKFVEAVTSTFMNEFCSNFSMFYMNVWTLLFRNIENQRKAGFRYRAEINRKYGFFRSDVKISAEKGARMVG